MLTQTDIAIEETPKIVSSKPYLVTILPYRADNNVDQDLADMFNEQYPKIRQFLSIAMELCAEKDHRLPRAEVEISPEFVTPFCPRNGCHLSASPNYLGIWHEGKQTVLRWSESKMILDPLNPSKADIDLGDRTETATAQEINVFTQAFRAKMDLN
jgi:hypothetical protein